MESLTTRISLLAIIAIAALEIPLGFFGHAFVIRRVDRIADAQLAQNAIALSETISGGPIALSVPASQASASNAPVAARQDSAGQRRNDAQVGFQYWGAANQLVAASGNFEHVALDAAPAGYADILAGGHRWRVFTLLDNDGRWLRVGERDDSRRAVARTLAAQTVISLGVGLPLLALVVAGAVRRGLTPVQSLAERIADRSPGRTDPIGPGALPSEFDPVVAAINVLLGRFKRASARDGALGSYRSS